MDEKDQEWMEYIDSEVRAVCNAKGWGHQIRRKASIGSKPVSDSVIDDYEWKLMPHERKKAMEAPPCDFDEGIYYVLSINKFNDKFIFQHDTKHCGLWGLHWEVETYTEINLNAMRAHLIGDEYEATHGRPPVNWLRDHLLQLISRFGPNNFSAT